MSEASISLPEFCTEIVLTSFYRCCNFTAAAFVVSHPFIYLCVCFNAVLLVGMYPEYTFILALRSVF